MPSSSVLIRTYHKQPKPEILLYEVSVLRRQPEIAGLVTGATGELPGAMERRQPLSVLLHASG